MTDHLNSSLKLKSNTSSDKMIKLRIGVFAWESLYSVKVGGIAPHVSELSETLAEKGNGVHIFTRSGELGDYEVINGVHYHRVTHDQSGSIVYQMDRMCDVLSFFSITPFVVWILPKQHVIHPANNTDEMLRFIGDTFRCSVVRRGFWLTAIQLHVLLDN